MVVGMHGRVGGEVSAADRPFNGGMAQWLVVLGKEVRDSDHAHHSQTERPHLRNDNQNTVA